MTVRIDDNFDKYTREMYEKVELAYKQMADDTRRYSQMKVPKDTGELRSTAEVEKLEGIHYKVWYDRYDDLGYALNQERGYDERAVYQHYSKPGTGAHYLENSIDRIARVFDKYIKKNLARVKL